MKRVLLVSLVLPLLVAGSADAKGIKWIKVCGPSDCTKTPERELDFEESPLIFPPWVMSGRPDPPPEQAAPWLRIRVAFARSERKVSSVVIPRLGYAGGDQEGAMYGWVWQRLNADEQRTYKRLGRGLARFPAATLPGLGEEARGRRAAPPLVAGSSAHAAKTQSYCSPSGDYCTAVTKRQGRIKLEVETFSFTNYLLCVTGPRGTDCLQARAEPGGTGLYKDRIDARRRFPQGPGKYKARWKVAGSFLGPALSFKVR